MSSVTGSPQLPDTFAVRGASLIAAGYLVVPIQRGSKRPALKEWERARLTLADLPRHAACGAGVLCGQGSYPVMAIDVDTHDPALAAAMVAWCERTIGLAPLRVGRPPKILLPYRAELPGLTKLTGPWLEDVAGERSRIEVLGAGQQFVAYAIHPETHLPYEWVDVLGGLEAVPAAELAVATGEQLAAAVEEFTRLAELHGMLRATSGVVVPLRPAVALDPLMRDDDKANDLPLAEARRLLAYVGADDRDAWISAGMALHHQFDGEDEALEVWDRWSATSSKYPGFEDVEKRWAGFGQRAPGRRPLTARWLVKAATAAGAEVLPRERPSAQVEAAKAIARAEASEGSWVRALERNPGTGQVLPNLQNVCHVLAACPEFAGRVRFNRFSMELVSTGALPWRADPPARFNGIPWTDADDTGLRVWLQRWLGKDVADRDIRAALHGVADACAFDPVVEMLERLAALWDGQPRLDEVLVKHMHAQDNIYTRTVGRRMLVAAVARAMRPGCKAEQIVVLQGGQGLKKSSFAAELAVHPELFADNPPDLADRRSLQEFLQGKWIVELSELSSLRGREVEHAKAFASCQKDRYRVPWSRRAVDHPRRCLIIGSVNKKTYLQDDTGNRRWWPVKCGGRLDVNALRAEVGQLWGEAVHAYRAGERWWIEEAEEPEIAALAEAAQEDARETSDDVEALAGVISAWADRPIARGHYERAPDDLTAPQGAQIERDRMCAMEVWVECLGGGVGNYTKIQAHRINAAIRTLEGWSRVPKPTRFGSLYGIAKGFHRVKTLPEAAGSTP